MEGFVPQQAGVSWKNLSCDLLTDFTPEGTMVSQINSQQLCSL